jgi:hypothetical protein
MSVTLYRSKRGITAYCATCRKRWHSDDPRYEVNEQEILKFEREHAHEKVRK